MARPSVQMEQLLGDLNSVESAALPDQNVTSVAMRDSVCIFIMNS